MPSDRCQASAEQLLSYGLCSGDPDDQEQDEQHMVSTSLSIQSKIRQWTPVSKKNVTTVISPAKMQPPKRSRDDVTKDRLANLKRGHEAKKASLAGRAQASQEPNLANGL